MKKIVLAAVLATTLVGIASTVQASHWVRGFWEQQDRQSGGGG